ncbi:MAG TPA: PEP-CTERM-box response regulator transcription factor [Opitutaceae bacterium]|jgi:two-component system NtrC family response regulator
MNPSLLIVDDDEEIRTQMKWALSSDYEIIAAGDRSAALEAFRGARPMVVLLDLGLPPNPGGPAEGLAALSEIVANDPSAKVVVITGQGEKEIALQAIGAGAYDFLGKPLDMDELKLLLRRCFHVAKLEREYREMHDRIQSDGFEGLLGSSTSMQAVFSSIRKVATTDAPVLILGESGTGKEMTARAIHHRSGRKDGAFVAINCGAIPETLMESELFGHEKGSFTGAHAQRKGRIESADGGTLFLDEIGEISPTLQVKLLRFLQERVIERIGGRQEIAVDTRVIAATNANLKKRMAESTFREDLYYRLAVVQILLPPLRDRGDDAVLLARSLLQRFAAENNRNGVTFGPDAVRAIRAYGWPGNVRELQNRVKRGVIMASGRRVTAEDLELESSAAGASSLSLKEARESLERELITEALRRHDGKVSAAAAELKVSRPTFYELMEKLGIHKPE